MIPTSNTRKFPLWSGCNVSFNLPRSSSHTRAHSQIQTHTHKQARTAVSSIQSVHTAARPLIGRLWVSSPVFCTFIPLYKSILQWEKKLFNFLLLGKVKWFVAHLFISAGAQGSQESRVVWKSAINWQTGTGKTGSWKTDVSREKLILFNHTILFNQMSQLRTICGDDLANRQLLGSKQHKT